MSANTLRETKLECSNLRDPPFQKFRCWRSRLILIKADQLPIKINANELGVDTEGASFQCAGISEFLPSPRTN